MDFYFGLVCASLLSLAHGRIATTLEPTANPLYPDFQNCGFNLSATCDDRMWLYADEELLVNSSDWRETSEVHIPQNTKVIEIHCLDSWIHGGILASSDNGLITDGAWKCSSDNRTTWNPAYLLGRNGRTAPDISSEAVWIWTDMSYWMQTDHRRHTKAICKIELASSECPLLCPLFQHPVTTPTAAPTVTVTPTPQPVFTLTATCDERMKLFADGNLVATSSSWRNTSQVDVPTATELIEIHCMDAGIVGGILASSNIGLITDGTWNCSSDNGTTWNPAYEVGPNDESLPDISSDAKWIWTGCINDWTSKYTERKQQKNVICKFNLVIDGGWSTWSEFSSCSATCICEGYTCGNATKTRTRTCSNPPPSNGGEPCLGLEEEVVSCGLSSCDCPYTDGYVDCPDWKNHCESGEFVDCMRENCAKTCKCAENGKWSTWSEFSSCSATCGDATKTRSRTCSNPPPSNGGEPCPGLEEEVVHCGLSPCVPCSYIFVKIIIRDSTTNDAIESATTILTSIEDESYSVNVNTSSNGVSLIPITENGEYMIQVAAEGFIDYETNFTMECAPSQCNLCNKTVPISLSPTIQQGEAHVFINWAENPRDLDIHVLQFSISNSSFSTPAENAQDLDIHGLEFSISNPSFSRTASIQSSFSTNAHNTDFPEPTPDCHISYMNTICGGLSLDVDNTQGGDNGAETITFNGTAQNNEFVYMVYVHNFNGNDQLGDSNLRLSLVNMRGTLHEDMDNTNFNNEHYWIAGCLRFEGNTMEWRAKNEFVSSNPLDHSGDLCIVEFQN